MKISARIVIYPPIAVPIGPDWQKAGAWEPEGYASFLSISRFRFIDFKPDSFLRGIGLRHELPDGFNGLAVVLLFVRHSSIQCVSRFLSKDALLI